jgi:hypothetical protein
LAIRIEETLRYEFEEGRGGLWAQFDKLRHDRAVFDMRVALFERTRAESLTKRQDKMEWKEKYLQLKAKHYFMKQKLGLPPSPEISSSGPTATSIAHKKPREGHHTTFASLQSVTLSQFRKQIPLHIPSANPPRNP